MLEFTLFVIGFFLLIRGAEWLVDGASELAKRLGINQLLVGLTVVAFGTSLPELIVNLFSVSADSSELAISNIIGSNISNTLLILGIIGLMAPLTVHRLTVYREAVFNIMASAMVLVLAADAWLLRDAGFHGLDRIDGLVLISYFVVFLYYTFGRTTFASSKPKPLFSNHVNLSREVPSLMGKIIIGSLALYLGGKWIVDGALYIADSLNMAESVIGLSAVAIGTSLPELAASLAAIKKKNIDIAVGNVLGSNLFNILWVLGLSAVIHPLGFTNINLGDALIGVGVAGLLFVSLAFGQFKHQISRYEARVFLTLYGVYLVTLLFR